MSAYALPQLSSDCVAMTPIITREMTRADRGVRSDRFLAHHNFFGSQHISSFRNNVVALAGHVASRFLSRLLGDVDVKVDVARHIGSREDVTICFVAAREKTRGLLLA